MNLFVRLVTVGSLVLLANNCNGESHSFDDPGHSESFPLQSEFIANASRADVVTRQCCNYQVSLPEPRPGKCPKYAIDSGIKCPPCDRSECKVDKDCMDRDMVLKCCCTQCGYKCVKLVF